MCYGVACYVFEGNMWCMGHDIVSQIPVLCQHCETPKTLKSQLANIAFSKNWISSNLQLQRKIIIANQTLSTLLSSIKQNINELHPATTNSRNFTWQCLHSRGLLLLGTLPSAACEDPLVSSSSPGDMTPKSKQSYCEKNCMY